MASQHDQTLQHRWEKSQASSKTKQQAQQWDSSYKTFGTGRWQVSGRSQRHLGEVEGSGDMTCFLLLPAAVAAASSARSRSFSCRSRSISRWWCLCSSSITCWCDDSISARLRSQASCHAGERTVERRVRDVKVADTLQHGADLGQSGGILGQGSS